MTETKVALRGVKWTPRRPTLWGMSDEKRRARPAVQYGPTAKAVAENVKRVRSRRGLTIYELAGALKKAERPITPSAIAKIEKGQRQVTVDDLTALSVALGVSPSALLLPLDDSPTSTMEITGAGQVPADVAWDWADGERPLKIANPDDAAEMLEHELYARPPGRRRTWNAGRDLLMRSEARGAEVVRRLAAEDGRDDG